MATIAEVKASADKIVGVINDVIPELGELSATIADVSKKLQDALAAGADPAALADIAAELDTASQNLQAAHDAAAAALPAAST